jgi:hypothetical protein
VLPDPLPIEWVKYTLSAALNPISDPTQPGLGFDPRFDRMVAYYIITIQSATLEALKERILRLASWRQESMLGLMFPKVAISDETNDFRSGFV